MPARLVCPDCGQVYAVPLLAAGERAQCVRCDATLAHGSRLGGGAALAFAVTGGVFAVPAVVLPFVHVSKFQAEHASYAFSGVRALWRADMHLLAIWVFLCGLLVPFLLLGSLTSLLLLFRFSQKPGGGAPGLLTRSVQAFEHWALPEVHVLAVLVAFAKLGSLVDVSPAPGLWCYAAMAACMLAAWGFFRHYDAPRMVTADGHVAAEEL